MLFLVRVALVIGALSYLALVRNGADPAAEARKLATLPPSVNAVPMALAVVPPDARERAVRDVLARGLIAELSRRAAAPEAATASRDTLEDADRNPAWRGIERH